MTTDPPDSTKPPASKTPEAIQKDQPKVTYEMPGPLGNLARQKTHNELLAKDRATARNEPASQEIRDKVRPSFVVSKEDVREQSKKLLEPEFKENSRNQLER